VSEDPTREDPTRGHGFDELARSLAEGSLSRRRALKLFAGTAIAALIPSRAMAITCPSGTVKVCDVPQRADDTCRRRRAKTKCVIPGSSEANAIAANPCSCCGGCGPTDNCREPKPRTCFSTTTAPPTTAPPTTAPPTTAPPTTAPPICSPTGVTANCGSCGSTGTCFCVKTAEGEIRCVENFGFVDNKSGTAGDTTCTLSTDCKTGDACFRDCTGTLGCAHPAPCTH